jgi:vacuolar-type H+-ATPase subunit H
MSTEGPNDPYRPQTAAVTEPAQSWSPVVTPGPSPSVQVTMNQMTDQLQTVIDAAERAATAIRQDAEEQARQHLADAQRKADRLTAERVRLIAQLTDDLLRHAGTVREQSEVMVDSLETAIRAVTKKLEEPPEAHIPQPAPASQPAVATSSEGVIEAMPQPAFESHHEAATLPSQPLAHPMPQPQPQPQPAVPMGFSQDALLQATRLAVSGADRETIAAMLRNDHGVADPTPIVDRVLGPPR